MLRRLGFFIVLFLWLIVAIWPGYYGWEYYITPLQERPFMELHQLLKPTGLIGHGYGIAGSLFMFIGVSTYSIRKRVPFFQNRGRLRTWLTFHIFLCTSGPILVLWHTSFKISGLVAISFWSMIIVVTSGVLGRYVYNRIPKTEEGHFKTVEFIEGEQSRLKRNIESYVHFNEQQEAELGLHAAALKFTSPWMALYTAIVFDISGLFRWSRDQRLLKSLQIGSHEQSELLGLIKSYRWRTRQQFLIEPLQKIFGYWHVFHVPLATIMFIILGVHVAVAILFGYTWVF
jgi:hypothetical protein